MKAFLLKVIACFSLLLVLSFWASCGGSREENNGVDVNDPLHIHDLEHHEGKAPSCTEEGYAAYDTCRNCDYSTYQKIAPTGHSIETIVITAPSASKAGKVREVCSVCGYKGAIVMLPAITDLEGDFSHRYVTIGEALEYTIDNVDPEALRFKWYINEELVSEEPTFTPTESCLEKTLSVRVFDVVGSEICSDKIFCSRLPVLYIETEDNKPITSKDYLIPGNMVLQGSSSYPDGTTLYSGGMQIRGRGNSTWVSFPKKPYKIKLDKSTDLFGFGKSKHWVLLANYLDESMVRNYLAHFVSEKIGLPTMQSVFVELILNGEHVGVYQLCEQIKVDKDRVPITSWENIAEDIAKAVYKSGEISEKQSDALEDALVSDLAWSSSGTFKFEGREYSVKDYITLPSLTGGLLIEMSREFDERARYMTTRGTPILFKDPEYLDTNSELWSYGVDYVQAFEDALFSKDFTTVYNGQRVSWRDMADMDSLMSFWFVCEFFCNEFGNKSTYMYLDIDGKLTFGPVWDFDYSSGGSNPWRDIDPTHWDSIGRWWFDRMFEDPEFIRLAYEKYPEFRNTVITLLDDGGAIDSCYALLKEAANVNSDKWFYRRGFEEDYRALELWIIERILWFDAQFESEEILYGSMFNNAPVSTPGSSANDSPGRVGIIVFDNSGKQILCKDTVENAKPESFAEIEKNVSALRIDVNVYSTAAVQLVLYINGKETYTVDLEPYDPDTNPIRYASFDVDASFLDKEPFNIIRIVCHRNQGHYPYQNAVCIKK